MGGDSKHALGLFELNTEHSTTQYYAFGLVVKYDVRQQMYCL